MYGYMSELKKYVNVSSNKSLNETVYSGLRTAIIKGIIPVGERINEKYYSEYLNISRTPIRNAIEKLKEEGIVEYIQNYGVVVKRISPEDAEEVYKIRIALETLATITAMNNMTEDEFKSMDKLLKITYEEHENHNVEEVIRLSAIFNSNILKFAKMPRLETIIGNLRDYLIRFRDISLYDDSRRLDAIKEHMEIVRLMKLKDEDSLRVLVEEHLNYSRFAVLNEINKLERERQEFLKNKYNI
ncbi:GntR family transcriptional regulator [Anaerosphaera multitolerans]|uniref:GntR family transcriptional regulator n=1 Tax=Anaerosphaera multitolerans TaxID=2487351 RepID=A0A437S8W0_9FIRM|nr:GntR family transcriptional regulator [Anaerosphaera multitolerans]RVU55267.1 GntR family transcriptional regulator [Anaerosphaera multitolerans]